MRKNIKPVPVAAAIILAAALAGAVAWTWHDYDSPRERERRDREGERLQLTLIVTDSAVTIGARGSLLPSQSYREFHRYVARSGRGGRDIIDTLVEYRPGDPMPINPRSGKPFERYEKTDINLFQTDDHNNLINMMYTKSGELLTTYDGEPVESVEVGDTLWALANPRRRVVVTVPGEFESRPLSVYDELQNRLMLLKDRYREAADGHAIIIAAEDGIIYDKIIKLMDAARLAGFPSISITKLRMW